MSQYPAQPPSPGSYPPGSYPPGPYPQGYPLPYGGYPHQYGGFSQQPFDAYSAPFTRAAIMLFITGGLFCACGIVCTALPWQTFLNQAASQGNMALPPEVNIDDLSVVYRVMGIAVALVGLVHLGLGFFVRKGSYGATITGIVVGVLEVLALLFMLLSALLVGGAGDVVSLVGAACTVGLPGAVVGLMLIWLIQAVRAAPALRAAQAQYQYQYWQYAQAQQGYVQPQQSYSSQQQPEMPGSGPSAPTAPPVRGEPPPPPPGEEWPPRDRPPQG